MQKQGNQTSICQSACLAALCSVHDLGKGLPMGSATQTPGNWQNENLNLLMEVKSRSLSQQNSWRGIFFHHVRHLLHVCITPGRIYFTVDVLVAGTRNQFWIFHSVCGIRESLDGCRVAAGSLDANKRLEVATERFLDASIYGPGHEHTLYATI